MVRETEDRLSAIMAYADALPSLTIREGVDAIHFDLSISAVALIMALMDGDVQSAEQASTKIETCAAQSVKALHLIVEHASKEAASRGYVA